MNGIRLCVVVLIINICFVIAAPRQVGVFYSTLMTFTYNDYQTVLQRGGVQLNVEQVIQSDGKYTIHDVFEKYNIGGPSYYHSTPKIGYYCLYRKRNNESSGILPDCPHISQVLKYHAQLLTDAQVDYIVLDSTNLANLDPSTDVLQLRPFEVIFEEWYALRQQGIHTPQIAIWATLPTGANIYNYYVSRLYENPLYKDLVYRHPATGKKVFWVVDNSGNHPDGQILNYLQNNLGYTIIHMWAGVSQSDFNNGFWSFQESCINPSGGQSTSIVGSHCNINHAPRSPVGSMSPVTGDVAFGYHSIPFLSSGTLGGLTQWQLWQNAISLGVDNVLVSSWNEFTGILFKSNPFSNIDSAYLMGLPNDPLKWSTFVDTYGSEFARNIEPSIEGGSAPYDLMKICSKFYKTGASCTASSDPCCTWKPTVTFANMWTFTSPTGNAQLMTKWPDERDTLRKSGWKEHCDPLPGPGSDVFCVGGTTLGSRGPFLFIENSQDPNITTVPFYRCKNWTFSTDPNCEGNGQDSQYGFLATKRSSVTPRALHRCRINNVIVASLDVECPPGTVDKARLGFVR